MKFHFSLSGYFNSNNYEVTYKAGTLVCIRSEFGHSPVAELVIPVAQSEAWEALVQHLVNSKWERQYESDYLDGTQWELKANISGHKINTYSNNVFPPHYEELLRLLNQITCPAGMEIE